MDTEELRGIIWDEIFRAKRAKSVEEIALLTDQEAPAVRAAVDHDWFLVTGDRVSIAMSTAESHGHR
jgi:hypothetical protein